MGLARLEGRASTTRTASSRRASSPASTARSTSPTTRATRSTPATATRTPRPACSTPTRRPRSSRCPEWRYKNFEWYAQDNWKAEQQADARLRRPLLLPDAAVGHDAAGVELPARPVQRATPPRSSTRRCASARLRARAASAAAWTRRSSRRASRRRWPTPSTERFIGRLTPGSNRFNGAFQAGQGINDQLQDGSAFRVSPRVGVVYDLTGQGRDHPARRLRDLLRPAAGQHGVRHDRQRARRAELAGSQWGRLQDLTSARAATRTRRSSLNPTAFDFKPPQRDAVERRASSTRCGQQRHPRRRLRGLQVDGPAPAGADQRGPVRRDVLAPQNQDPTRAPSAMLGSSALPNDLLRPYPGLRRHPDVGLQRLLELPRAADVA